jgi:hypothetical protein
MNGTATAHCLYIFCLVAFGGATYPGFDVRDEGIRMKNLKTMEHDKGGK